MSGTISAYDTAKGKRYRVRYRKPDRSQTDKRGFKTKREAELFLASVTVAKATGEYIDPAQGRNLVSSFADRWKTTRVASLKPSSRVAMETAWRVHVEPRWGSRAVSGITTSEVEEWVAELGKEKSPQTVRRIMFVLSMIMQLAERDRAIRANPTRGITLPAKRAVIKRYLTHAQVESLARAAGANGALVRVLAYTGLRWGEAAALRVRHLDALRKRLLVEENAVIVNGVYEIGTPKTGKSRVVPLPQFLIAALTELARGKLPDAYLFGPGAYPPPYPHATSGWFTKAVRAARAGDSAFPSVTPHKLRHTAASLAVSAGANVKAVQRMLGHASAAMTLDVYADLFDDDLESVATALGEARAAAIS